MHCCQRTIRLTQRFTCTLAYRVYRTGKLTTEYSPEFGPQSGFSSLWGAVEQNLRRIVDIDHQKCVLLDEVNQEDTINELIDQLLKY